MPPGRWMACTNYQRYIYNATRKYYLLGRDLLLNELEPDDGSTVLEIGCGTGRNLIHAARRWPNARFVGFDISHAMLETAWTSTARAGLSDRIAVYQADATSFDLSVLCGEAHVGRVFISYTLSMVPHGGGCWRGRSKLSVPAAGYTSWISVSKTLGNPRSRQCCSLCCVSSLCIRGRNSRPNSIIWRATPVLIWNFDACIAVRGLRSYHKAGVI